MLDADARDQGVRGVSRGWPGAVVGGLLLWAAVRAVVSVVSVVAWAAGGTSPEPDTGSAGGGFFALLHHWDSVYYLSIADAGYFSNDPAALTAFFPGYPSVGRALAQLIALGSPTNAVLVVALCLISAASSLAAAIVLWRLTDVIAPAGTAPLATVMFLAGPYAVFLYANYSESLFLAFAVAGWYCAVRDRWWLVGLWCGLATATRINGCFLLVALVVMYVVHRRRDHLRLWAPVTAWVLLAGTGVAAYFGYLAVRTGDLLAWNTAQSQGWGRGLQWPWQAFYQTAGRVLYASTIDRRLQFALDIVFAAVILTAILVWIRRRDWPPAVYAGLTLIALITSFTFVSLGRNSLTLFPLTVLAAVTVRRSRHRWAGLLLLACWTGLFLVNTTLFALGYWAD